MEEGKPERGPFLPLSLSQHAPDHATLLQQGRWLNSVSVTRKSQIVINSILLHNHLLRPLVARLHAPTIPNKRRRSKLQMKIWINKRKKKMKHLHVLHSLTSKIRLQKMKGRRRRTTAWPARLVGHPQHSTRLHIHLPLLPPPLPRQHHHHHQLLRRVNERRINPGLPSSSWNPRGWQSCRLPSFNSRIK